MLATPHAERSDRARSTSRPGRGVRSSVVAVLAGAGLLTALATTAPLTALAQLKPDTDAGVETPYGRAPLSFADIIEKVKPAVVSISVASGGTKVAKKEGGGGGGGNMPGMPDVPEDHPLYDFFKNLPREFRGQPQAPRPSQGQGSGFVISEDGYVVTNNHVIDGANKIEVSFDDQEKMAAELVGTDPRTDLALLKVKTSKPFPFVKFAGKPARVGDWAIAVGNPFGLGGTVTAGIVSALSRDIGSGPYDFLQIDAAVNRGNSGGPTFNLSGEVIGVNTAIFSPSGGNVGIAFAVPANTAVDVIEQLKSKGTVSRGWLGVKIQNIDEDARDGLGLTEAKGALVSEVTPNGPAAEAGFQPQDAIISVNDQRINDSRDLSRKIAEIAPNSMIDVKVWRGSSEKVIKVKLGTFPGSSEEIAKLERGDSRGDDQEDESSTSMNVEQLGLKLMPARAGGGKEGVVIAEVDPESDAAQKGLKAGDIILKVDSQTVTNPADVTSSLKTVKDKGLKAVLMSVKSGDQTRLVAVRFTKS
ncbi:MAG: Do family serine endopeptidase [Hyphomicrobium sp.]